LWDCRHCNWFPTPKTWSSLSRVGSHTRGHSFWWTRPPRLKQQLACGDALLGHSFHSHILRSSWVLCGFITSWNTSCAPSVGGESDHITLDPDQHSPLSRAIAIRVLGSR